jgi:methyl-accepting chemotaxis protein
MKINVFSQLHVKLIVFIVVIVVLVSGVTQYLQYQQTHDIIVDLADANITLLEEREEHAAKNVYLSVENALKGSLERGEMVKFSHILNQQNDIDGLLEFSLFSRDGIVTHSSKPEFIRKEMDPEIRQRIEGNFDLMMNKTDNALEIYKPQFVNGDCIRCHTTWKLGENGGTSYFRFSNEALKTATAHSNNRLEKLKSASLSSSLWSLVAMTAITCFMVYVLIALFVKRPLNGFIGFLEQFEKNEGDLTQRFKVSSKDEFGYLATLFNSFIHKLEEAIIKVVVTSKEVVASSADLTRSSVTLNQAANMVTTKATEASTASQSINANMQSVAAGVEEMTVTLKDLAENAGNASSFANAAQDKVSNATGAMNELSKSSQEIDQVVQAITSIAEQTNLLALNATIEAARAGDAGKGFAVVANEVKELAAETARLTDDIKKRVASIQSDSNSATEVMKDIAESFAKLNEFTHTIAAAVEEQTVTTSQMNRELSDATQGVDVVAANSKDVVDSATSTLEISSSTHYSAEGLSEKAKHLQETVAEFKVSDKS